MAVLEIFILYVSIIFRPYQDRKFILQFFSSKGLCRCEKEINCNVLDHVVSFAVNNNSWLNSGGFDNQEETRVWCHQTMICSHITITAQTGKQTGVYVQWHKGTLRRNPCWSDGFSVGCGQKIPPLSPQCFPIDWVSSHVQRVSP